MLASRHVSVTDVVTFYKCKACFLERLENGRRGKHTVKTLLGEMLHKLAERCLRGEAEIMERLYANRRLDPRSLRRCYKRFAEDASKEIALRYGGKLVKLAGSLESAQSLLLRASRNIVEQRSLELFKDLRSMGFQQLLHHLHARSFGERLYSRELRLCGSPDMLEVDRVVDFKYSKPGPDGMVREDIVLQLTLYSLLSGRKKLRVVYLPSFIHEDFQLNDAMAQWALRILDELFDFLSNTPEKVEHTCIHPPRYVSVRGEFLWAESISSHQ